MTDKEEFTKHFMKFKKPEMVEYLWKIRSYNEKLREEFESIVDKDTYREHSHSTSRGYEYLYFKFKAAIARYLGEEIK
jgi:hypothetical protein